MTVCERIDNILQSRNMSRRQLALKSGIAPSSLQSAMSRNGSLSLDMLFPISDFLGVPMETLLDLEEIPTPTDDDYVEITKDRKDRGEAHMRVTLAMEKLNELGVKKAVERVEELAELPKYTVRFEPITDEEREAMKNANSWGEIYKILTHDSTDAIPPENEK